MTTFNDLKERYDKLPELIKNILYSEDLDDMITDVGERQRLHVDQMGILDEYIHLMLLGVKSREDFVNDFSRSANVPKEKAQEVAKAVNGLILEPLKEALQQTENTKNIPPSSTPAEIVQSDVHADDIMNAISNPSSIPSPSRTIEVAAPAPTPAPAPTVPTPPPSSSTPLPATTLTVQPPNTSPTLPAEVAPHDLKLAEPVHIVPTKTDTSVKTASLIPPEVKDRINKDRYKEPI